MSSCAQICGILAKVAKKEGLQLPEALATRIAQASERNLRKAILMLEACRVQQYPFTDSQQIELPDWQRYTQQVAANIMAEQSPRRCVLGFCQYRSEAAWLTKAASPWEGGLSTGC